MIFVYHGADGLFRSLSIKFLTPPSKREKTSVRYDVTLKPRETKEIRLELIVMEVSERDQLYSKLKRINGRDKTAASDKGRSSDWLNEHIEYESESLLLNSIINNSFRDFQMLVSSIDDSQFFAAGLPWFATLFGCDSLIAGMQTLAIQPEIAAETLRLLAKFQAQKVDPWRDAQPGKILHELRVGEFAHLGEIPQTPYYGTVDATPLFLILLAQHAEWTGDLSLFQELRSAVEAALTWLDQYGDANGDGYVEYESKSQKGLINQGWKDSGNAILDADGRLATPPISLVEVQGYVYSAKLGLASLFERAGEKDRATPLRQQAQKLRSKFNQDYWMEDDGIYTLALEANGKPLRVVSSNPGHALWAGIADPEKARRTAERLMANDMFSGWGIRTVSAQEQGYNPTGYHLGTVWPHDNAFSVLGFRRYGFDEYAERILKGIVEAAMNFRHYRLPELFAGFWRDEYNVPVHYPVACHPQAWAAGSIPYMIASFLGFEPNAFEHQLRIRRPILPDFIDRIHVRHLRVGDASVDLHYERQANGEINVDVDNAKGTLNVVRT